MSAADLLGRLDLHTAELPAGQLLRLASFAQLAYETILGATGKEDESLRFAIQTGMTAVHRVGYGCYEHAAIPMPPASNTGVTKNV